MFKAGQPIQDRDEDSLGRWPFALSLAEAILGYQETESIAIGLYGTWGAGKTSVLNLLEHAIYLRSVEISPQRRPVIVHFNPWHYSDQNQLIAMFFRDLSINTGNKLSDEKAKRISELFDSLSLYFFCLAAIPQAAPVTIGAAITLKTLGELFKRFTNHFRRDHGPDLIQLKKELDLILSTIQNKIVIIMDDIDRLNSTEIRQIFQLVKSVADFKNTDYVLAFDKKVVIKALDKVQEKTGQLYLEKIVPVCFDIVSPDRSRIRKELHDRLKAIVADAWEEKIWEGLYADRLRPFFSTLRDVTRFLNTFLFSYGLLAHDVRFEDLAVITAIQVHEPAIYSEIHKNKGLFAGEYRRSPISAMMSDSSESQLKEHLKQECEKILKLSTKIPVEELREVVKITFPRIDAIYSSSTTESDGESEWRTKKRICSPEYFSRYFKLLLSADEFSQKELDAILSTAVDTAQFLGELERLRHGNRLSEFLETMQFLISRQLVRAANLNCYDCFAQYR